MNHFRARLKFSKTGRLKYIGHLDLLDIFNRAVKSAKLPVDYSKGFNPHMLIAFASPLSLGIESLCEYVDIDFTEEPVNLLERINKTLPDNLEVTETYKLNQPYKRAASLVTHAKYSLKGLGSITEQDIESFFYREKIEIQKKTKRKNELADIKPDIKEIKITPDSLTVILACGSFQNLKPSLFIQALCNYLEKDVPLYKISVTRLEIYCDDTPLSLIL